MRVRRRQVVDMTLRGGHGPHTADWRATRDKETLEVDMSDDWVDVVEERHAAEAEVERLRRDLKALREHVIRSSWDQAEYDAEAALRDVWERIDAILRGDNHE